MEDDGGGGAAAATAENQFEKLRRQLKQTVKLKERIGMVVVEMESTNRLLHSSLLFLHLSPLSEVLDMARVHINVLKELLGKLSEIHRDCPGEYYRYHSDWKNEMQMAVSALCFLHWLETQYLLTHSEAEEKLGLNASEFGLDIEDYLIGVCFMSNELPRYVVNQVTAGNFECPKMVLSFLTDLYAAFRMLNLRNDFLRRKFDSIKYDLRRVTEVYYDVKIRGLIRSEDTTRIEETHM